MSYRTRPAQEDDVPVLVDMMKAMRRELDASDLVNYVTKDRVSFWLLTESPHRVHVHVAEWVDPYVLIGYAAFTYYTPTWRLSTVAFLQDLYVKPEYRRKVVGQWLFQSVVDHAQEKGAACVELNCLTESESSKGFYRSLGLNEFGPAYHCLSFGTRR
jgi:GNAT superfamily N-acetyltransferase